MATKGSENVTSVVKDVFRVTGKKTCTLSIGPMGAVIEPLESGHYALLGQDTKTIPGGEYDEQVSAFIIRASLGY